MADPWCWPTCPECDVAWVLRRGLSMTEGWVWVWNRDCKHKKAEPVLAYAKGRHPTEVSEP